EKAAGRGFVDDASGARGIGHLRGAIGDELEGEHAAESADVADRGLLRLQRYETIAKPTTEAVGAIDEPFLLEHLEHGERRRAGERIPAIGAAETAGERGVHDLRLPDDGR